MLQPENVVDYQNGTHVGFQDQVGWGKQGFLQVLPKLDPLLAGLLSALKDLRVPVLKFFPGLSEEFIKSIGAVVNPLDFALLEKQAASINQLPLAASELSQASADWRRLYMAGSAGGSSRLSGAELVLH